MGKKAFDSIMAGLQDVLAYVQGDETTVHRIVEVDVKPTDKKPSKTKKKPLS